MTPARYNILYAGEADLAVAFRWLDSQREVRPVTSYGFLFVVHKTDASDIFLKLSVANGRITTDLLGTITIVCSDEILSLANIPATAAYSLYVHPNPLNEEENPAVLVTGSFIRVPSRRTNA